MNTPFPSDPLTRIKELEARIKAMQKECDKRKRTVCLTDSDEYYIDVMNFNAVMDSIKAKGYPKPAKK